MVGTCLDDTAIVLFDTAQRIRSPTGTPARHYTRMPAGSHSAVYSVLSESGILPFVRRSPKLIAPVSLLLHSRPWTSSI